MSSNKGQKKVQLIIISIKTINQNPVSPKAYNLNKVFLWDPAYVPLSLIKKNRGQNDRVRMSPCHSRKLIAHYGNFTVP